MNINYLPHQECIELKKIGFDKETDAMFEISLTESIDIETNDTTGIFGWEKGEVNFNKTYFINNHPNVDFTNENWLMVSAPLIQQVFRWFREKGIYCNISCVDTFLKVFRYEIMKDNNIIHTNISKYEKYEDCEIDCIKEVINTLKY